MLSPAEASLRGRIGAHVLHSLYDARETTANARATFLAKFEREVDPDGILPPAERERRAISARKAYFARLALKSARARSAKGRGRAHNSATPVAMGVSDRDDVETPR